MLHLAAIEDLANASSVVGEPPTTSRLTLSPRA